MPEADDIIMRLDLKPHPEGGFYRESFRDCESVSGRAHSTAVYYLLRVGEESRWHRVDAAEIWHFYGGDALEFFIAETDAAAQSAMCSAPIWPRASARKRLCPPVPGRVRARLAAFTLVGCTAAPGFEFSAFEMAPKGWTPPRGSRG